jgi:hypothetical protein
LLGTRGWDYRFYPRPTFIRGAAWNSGVGDDSCRSLAELGDSQEVIAGGDQVGVHLHPLATAITSATQPADSLHPAEGLFNPFADPLTDGVARMAHSASVDRRATCAGQILSHMRRDLERTAGRDEVVGIVALVAAQRDPSAPGQTFTDHCNRSAPLGTSIRRLNLKVDQDGVAILHQRDGWITDLSQLSKLKPLAGDKSFRDSFRKATRETKADFAKWLKSKTGETVDPDSIFDCQVKRIHEYKRQLLNALRIVVLYNRILENPNLEIAPRTFFFSGKAAPAYHLAKLIIKFINNLAVRIDRDPVVRGQIKVLFLPEYDVSLAERLIPAGDVSNQISTAGYEASGTSNMKFMMNGALTIGTRDGATIEMAQEAGEENFFLFGLTAQQVADSRGWYNPHWHYEHEPETRAALNLIFSDHFSRHEPGVFEPLRDTLLTHGDYYMHLADLTSYLDADRRLVELYASPEEWTRKAILNVAGSGKFSSDRTIAQYAREVWDAKPCPVG